MSEIITPDKDKLAEYMAKNNLDVLNNVQLSAILMHHEELLKQVLTFASDNIKSLESRILALESWKKSIFEQSL